MNTLPHPEVPEKVLTDTAIKTADAGYLNPTTWLMLLTMLLIRVEDCGTKEGYDN